MPRQAMLYNPPVDENGIPWKAEDLAPFVDDFILTSKPERESYALDMLKVNSNITFGLYMLQHAAHLYYRDMPNNNQILNRKGEAKRLILEHPALPLHYPDGKIILKNQKQDYVVVNSAHPIWRKLYPERVAEIVKRAPFYKYLLLDDVGTEKRFNYIGLKDVKEFATRELYFEHTYDWLVYTTQHVALANGLRPGANLQAPANQFEDFKRAAGVLLLGGGHVMQEWYIFNSNGELKTSDWLNSFQKAEYVMANGGKFMGVFQLDPRRLFDQDSDYYRKFEFALRSHMLLDNGKASIRVADQYDIFVNIPAIRGIDTQLGKSKGEYRKEGDYFFRDFENFGVAVNPQTFDSKLVEPPIIVNPPAPQVTLSINLQLELDASVAQAVQQAFTNVDVTVTSTPVETK